LRTAYTGSAIRVRRSSDNTEQDIGFVAGELDTVALLAFCGVGNGFVTTWYDQSGNARNLAQATASSQPRIVNIGVVELQNNKPVLKFDGNNDNFKTGFGFTLLQPINIFITCTHPIFSTQTMYIYDSDGNPRNTFLKNNTNRLELFASQSFALTATLNADQRYLLSVLTNGNVSYIRVNGSETTGNPGASGMDGLTLGSRFTDSDFTVINYQEFVLYNSNQDTNKTNIELNINTYYAIY
jgi:hypothetical protein